MTERGYMSEIGEKAAKIAAAAAVIEMFSGGLAEAKEAHAKYLDAIEQSAKADNPEADPMTGAQIIDQKIAGDDVVGVRQLEQVTEGGENYYEDMVVAVGKGVEGRIKFVNSQTGEEVPIPAGMDRLAEEWKAITKAQKALETEGQHANAEKKLVEMGKKLATEMRKGAKPPAFAAK